ncbi:DUF551 domain-containing protein [Klebsiella variicola]|uniref:DUF551 domain-containing protein n=1 Tax=Klebsiella variicola TaxID=244366 RepID=UPI00215A2A82|nr:DUF551 domain-containing protein [Klebsiella variicola]
MAITLLAAMDSSESVELPLDYLQGHKDGLEWAARLAEANHPDTGDWLYDDPIELAKAIRKGPDMPPAQPVADSEPVIVVGDDGGDALSYRRLIQSFEPGTKLYRHAQPAPVVPNGLRLALSNAGIAAPESDEMLAATCEKHIQALVTWVRDRKPFQSAPVVMDDRKLRSLFDSWFASDCSFDLSPEASEEDNIAWRESYWYVWQRCRAAMLQELKKSAGTEAICRSDENVQVLHTKSPAQSDCCPAQNQGWIPVSERMPEDEQEVLTINKMGHRFVSFFDKHSGLFFDRLDAPAACCIERVLVTHWMPLPAAPQEVK